MRKVIFLTWNVSETSSFMSKRANPQAQRYLGKLSSGQNIPHTSRVAAVADPKRIVCGPVVSENPFSEEQIFRQHILFLLEVGRQWIDPPLAPLLGTTQHT